VAIAVATLAAGVATARRDVTWMVVLLFLGIPAQAVIGGITVRTDLNPWVVAFHLLVSLAIIGLSVRLLLSLDGPLPPPHRGWVTRLAWATFAAGWAVLYLGTVVTGSGPHAGDEDALRNGLDPRSTSQLHTDLVFLFVGLTVGLLFALLATGHRPRATRAVAVLLAVEVAQGAIGFVQYATDLPVVLVGFHLFGAALISACLAWALLEARHERV
jgi:cytochrome c oxidase assembly protein subunit 15